MEENIWPNPTQSNDYFCKGESSFQRYGNIDFCWPVIEETKRSPSYVSLCLYLIISKNNLAQNIDIIKYFIISCRSSLSKGRKIKGVRMPNSNQDICFHYKLVKALHRFCFFVTAHRPLCFTMFTNRADATSVSELKPPLFLRLTFKTLISKI